MLELSTSDAAALRALVAGDRPEGYKAPGILLALDSIEADVVERWNGALLVVARDGVLTIRGRAHELAELPGWPFDTKPTAAGSGRHSYEWNVGSERPTRGQVDWLWTRDPAMVAWVRWRGAWAMTPGRLLFSQEGGAG